MTDPPIHGLFPSASALSEAPASAHRTKFCPSKPSLKDVQNTLSFNRRLKRIKRRNLTPYEKNSDSLDKERGLSYSSCLAYEIETRMFRVLSVQRGCIEVTHGREHSLEDVSND